MLYTRKINVTERVISISAPTVLQNNVTFYKKNVSNGRKEGDFWYSIFSCIQRCNCAIVLINVSLMSII